MCCPRILKGGPTTVAYFDFAAPLHSLHAADDEVDLALTDIFFGSDDEPSSLFLSHPTIANIMPSAATAISLFIKRLLAAPSHALRGRRAAAFCGGSVIAAMTD
jgi:hypothetical protein